VQRLRRAPLAGLTADALETPSRSHPWLEWKVRAWLSCGLARSWSSTTTDGSERSWRRSSARTGYRTVEAGSGEEALKAAGEEELGAVLFDVHLPGLSGHEVCRKLRDRAGGGPPILFVSGERTESFDRVGGLLVGGDDYLVKPFSPDELLARIRSLIRRSEAGASRTRLTRRQTEILQLLAAGFDQEEIAARLDVSSHAVRGDLKDILSKVALPV
jgi:DNA-binding response OmpR family regulator